MTAPATKTCPGYGPDGPHDLPATTEYFHKNAPAKDGLFNQCKPHANAYQADWGAKRRAIAKADAMPLDGGEGTLARDAALVAAYAMPPASKRKAPQDMAPAPRPAAAVPATGIAANTPRDQYVQAQGGQPGWGISRVSGQEYPVPTDKATVGTPEGQAALQAVAVAKRAADASRKRDQRAAAKAAATA